MMNEIHGAVTREEKIDQAFINSQINMRNRFAQMVADAKANGPCKYMTLEDSAKDLARDEANLAHYNAILSVHQN